MLISYIFTWKIGKATFNFSNWNYLGTSLELLELVLRSWCTAMFCSASIGAIPWLRPISSHLSLLLVAHDVYGSGRLVDPTSVREEDVETEKISVDVVRFVRENVSGLFTFESSQTTQSCSHEIFFLF